MDNRRQEAFQKLRPPCVELSSVTLQFKTKQIPVKDVLRAVQNQHRTIEQLSQQDLLDAKLAEYAFFPLTQIFNEAKNLSAGCLETAVQTVILLVSRGWRTNLVSQMGKQLLILMSLLAGGDPSRQTTAPTDEVKAAAFGCIAVIIEALGAGDPKSSVMKQQSSANIVDQLVYLLAENLAESTCDFVQIAAARALHEIFKNISNRILLASLLPRTVSSAVKALRPSSHARRSFKVLSSTIQMLQTALYGVLGGDSVSEPLLQTDEEKVALDTSWLKATATQVRNALIQVTKLRDHERIEVREALSELCVTVIESCSKALSESMAIMVETMVILSNADHTSKTSGILKHLIMSRPDLADILRTNFYDWSQNFPRAMQSNDDLPREAIIQKLTSSYNLILGSGSADNNLIGSLTLAMLNGMTNIVDQQRSDHLAVQAIDSGTISNTLSANANEFRSFKSVLLAHQSQQAFSIQFQSCIKALKDSPSFGKITRSFVDAAANSRGSHKIAALWLAIQCLRNANTIEFDIDDLVLSEPTRGQSTSLANLTYDLYSATKDVLMQSSPYSGQEVNWQLVALSLEVLVLQGKQLGIAYRDEFYETLYPILALFRSKNSILCHNAATALNQLASACQYTSVQEMLIENVDYLVNSIAWKLNIFSLSPEAPQVLNMVLQLVGAKLIPHLDDLVASIFVAVDNFHGYPVWVEMMFSVLKTIINECVHQPDMAITEHNAVNTKREKAAYNPRTIDETLANLRTRRLRKSVDDQDKTDQDAIEHAPRQPWKVEPDNTTHQPDLASEDISIESMLKQDQEASLPAPSTMHTNNEDLSAPVTKTHSLLLKIAQATVPHLSSPAPEVRHLLLGLLLQVSPLLACHENTFLPFINTVWPALVARLFTDQSISSQYDRDRDRISSQSSAVETSYNIIATVEVVSILCRDAGDFMNSRITQIFRPLINLFSQTRRNVKHHSMTSQKKDIAARAKRISAIPQAINSRSATEEIPDLRQGLASSRSMDRDQHDSQVVEAHANGTKTKQIIDLKQPVIRGSQARILTSLVDLLTMVLCHVAVAPGLADEIIVCLTPFIAGPEHRPQESGPEMQKRIRGAIEVYNPDLLWLIQANADVVGNLKDENSDNDD